MSISTTDLLQTSKRFKSMLKLKDQIKHKSKAWIIEKMFTYSGSEYQRDRFSKEKFAMIADKIDCDAIGNVLDVGCNEGYITAEFAKLGKFCVGVDTGPLFLNQVLTNVNASFKNSTAAYGVFSIGEDNVQNLPNFDLILLLSVHHQLVNLHGDEYAKSVVKKLIEKSNRYFVIEFAATASKYGYTEPQFEDNDEASIKNYAENWISSLNVDRNATYIGKNREHTDGVEREPYRFSYLLRG